MDKEKWFERRRADAKENDEDLPTEDEWKLYLAEMKDWRLPVEDLKKRFWTEEVQELIDSYSPEAFQELYFRKLASKRKIQNIQKKQKEKLAQFILKTPEKKDSAFSETFRKVCYGVGKEGKHFTTKEVFNPPEDDLIYIFHSPERKEADCLSRADLYRNFLRNEVREWTGQQRRLVSIPNDKLPPMWVLWTDEFKNAHYFAFELQKPKMMQIGSTFGVSSLHGAKELVYRVTPIDPNDSSIADLAAIPRRKDTEYLKEIKVQKQRYWEVIVLAEQISSFIEQNNSEPPDLDDFIEDLVHNDELDGALRESLPQMSKMLVLASRFISERAKRILLNQLEMIFEEESEIYFQEEIDIYNALYVENFDNDKIKNRANPGIVVKFNPDVDLFYFRGAENVYNAIFQEENISEMRLDVSREEFLHVAKHYQLPKMNIWYEILPTMTFEEMKSMNKLYHQAFPNDISQTHYCAITPSNALLEFSSPYYVNKLAPYLDNFDDSKDSGLNMFLIKDKVLNKLGKNGLKLVLRGCFLRSHFLKRYERRFLDKLITKISDSDFETALEPYLDRFVYFEEFSTEVLYYLMLKKPKSPVLKKLMSKYGQTSMSYLHNQTRNEALKKFVTKNPELVEGGGMNTLLYLNGCLGPEPQTIVDKNREKILLDFLNR